MQFKKISQKLAGLMALSALTLAAPAPASAGDVLPIEEQQVNYDAFEEEELTEFTEEVADAVAEDDLEKDGEFDLKRLLVLSETDAFDVHGAADVLAYDGLYVLSYDSVKETKAAYKALQKETGILSVEADHVVEAAGNAAPGEGKADADYGKAESGVTVAVLDTGYDISYYKGERILDSGYNVSGSGDEASVLDDNSHGTQVTNIILENSKASVLPLKVADAEGRTSGLRLYIGMKQAIAEEADVINISMAAYKSKTSELMDSIITEAKEDGILTVVSAGNYGEDVKDYSPANAKDAVTVAALDKNGKRLSSSNYGDAVDYSAYGKAAVGGIGGKMEETEGTSVAAAYVSGMLADAISDNGYADARAALDALAKDLGGGLGKGLTPKDADITGDAEEPTEDPVKPSVTKSELLTCDWKSLSSEKLNALCESTHEIDIKRFWDDLTKEEKDLLLSDKDGFFNRKHTLVTFFVKDDGSSKKESQIDDTIAEYLDSDYFPDYTVQKDLTASGTNNNAYDSEGGSVKVKTSEGGSAGVLTVKIDGPRTTDGQKFKVSYDNGTHVNFGDIAVAGWVTGNTGIHYNHVKFKNIKITKSAHSTVSGLTADIPDAPKVENKHDVTGNHLTDYGSPGCASTSFKTSLIYTDADEECSQPGNDSKVRTYGFKISVKGSSWGAWANNGDAVPGTCAVQGYQPQKRNKTCDGCGAVVDTGTQNAPTGFAPHNYANQPWVDDRNAYSHHQDCVNYAACKGSANSTGSRVTHIHDNWHYTVITPANCTSPGTQRKTCGTCGYHEDSPIPALGHDWYWHADTNNGIPNGRLWVQCDRPGCNEGPNKKLINSDRYRLVLDKDEHIKSVSQTATESLSSLASLGKTDQINGLDATAYHAVGATATITAAPNIGYHFNNWSMSAADERSVSWRPNEDPTAFGMPGSAITVKANSAINTSTLVVNPDFKTNRYKTSCDAYWKGSSDPQSFGPKNWHSTKDIPLPTRTGYDFIGWTLTSDHPNDGPGTMSSLTAAAVFTYGSDWAPVSTDTITAKWTPRNDTKYVVRHWQQNLGYIFDGQPNGYDTFEMDDYENYYTLADTENLQGTSDKTLQFKEIAKDYKGFHFVGGRTNDNDGPFVINSSTRILPDGKTEIDLFYARNRYQVDVPVEGYGDTTLTGEIGKTGNPSGDWFLYGDNITVTYEPNDGWCTKYIVVDGTEITGADLLPYLEEYKFPAIEAHHTVKVVFKRLPHLNITSLCGTDKDAVTAWNHVMRYRVTGTDYLGRERSYLVTTEDFDKPYDKRVLPGEYTVTPQPLKPWHATDGSVDQFQKGAMTDTFAITVDVTDCKDTITERKAPTASFQYTFMPDWEHEGDSNTVVNKLKK